MFAQQPRGRPGRADLLVDPYDLLTGATSYRDRRPGMADQRDTVARMLSRSELMVASTALGS
jgi:hypothetical protein